MGRCIASGFYETLLDTVRNVIQSEMYFYMQHMLYSLQQWIPSMSLLFKDAVEMMSCSAVVLENEPHYIVLPLFMNV